MGSEIGVVYNAGPLPNFAEYDFELRRAGHVPVGAAVMPPPKSVRCSISIDGQTIAREAAAGTTGSWQPDTQAWSIEASSRSRRASTCYGSSAMGQCRTSTSWPCCRRLG